MKPRSYKRTHDLQPFTNALLRWFAREGRDLPWRKTRDPYRIWVSEIMLQQTQVDRVERDYYHQFLKTFPTARKLATTSWPLLLERWRGLGYYRRARNMLKTAQAVLEHHGGIFPTSVKDLEQLPGIGPYTARAIAVFAYELDELVLDTNTTRVLSRVLTISDPDPRNQLRTMQEVIVPKGKSWAFHQALMDLGATICTAKTPTCSTCPVRRHCSSSAGNALKAPAKTTVKTRKLPSDLVDVAAGVIHRRGKLLITERVRGHLKGYWEFPGGKREGRESWRDCLKRELMEELGIEVAVRPHDWEVIHPYPDRTVRIRFHRCSILHGEATPRDGQRFTWVRPQELLSYRFPAADAQILDDLMKARYVDPEG